ncbi:alpha/beta hydrolase [Streptomyces anulatus]|uniref:alpha/beta hydrolase n=1 Tax=Streptomyces anulatus TaxID=1892 RepID=UPI001C272BCD|nr:alpha/beta hydrolase fold domain-containing protein [Streptomyces anulatus]
MGTGVVAEDLVTGDTGVRLRVYRAAAADRRGEALLWIHGGGFVTGSLEMPESDAVCAAIADRGVTCVSVEYRLAPGFAKRRAQQAPGAVRFPLPLEDCEQAWRWLLGHAEDLGADPDSLYVGGASAGGALAATLALRMLHRAHGGHSTADDAARDSRGGPTGRTGPQAPSGVALAYPFLHAALPPSGPDLRHALRGWRRLGTFTNRTVHWMAANYVGRGNLARLPEAFPGGRDLTGFPRTLIVNSERDTLRASGEGFAEELKAHGRSVEVDCEPGTSHGHLNKPGTAAFDRTVTTITAWLTTGPGTP